MLESHRQQVVRVARRAVALRLEHGLRALPEVLGEGRTEQADDRDVQSVQPDDRLGGAVHAFVAVVVPGPGRRDDEVARVHRGALAVDRGVGAAAVQDEAKRRLGVPVARCHLAGQDQLQPGVQAGRDQRLAAHRRVLQDQHPPDRLLGGDQRTRLHQVGLDLRPVPDRGVAGHRGLGRHQRVKHLPQRGHVLAVDALVEARALRLPVRLRGDCTHGNPPIGAQGSRRGFGPKRSTRNSMNVLTRNGSSLRFA